MSCKDTFYPFILWPIMAVLAFCASFGQSGGVMHGASGRASKKTSGLKMVCLLLGLGDGASTVYAAARVAGAAELVRHKFPKLTGKLVKNLLLKTATDLGDRGVDPIYGHGRLNLLEARSPQGTLIPVVN